MKTKISLVIFAIFFAFALPSYSQMSKKERKEWKKRAKELKNNPEELKALEEENESLKSSVASLNSQLENVKAQLADKNAQISAAQAEAQEAKAMAQAATERAQEMSNQPQKNPEALDESGTWFKVQVGAFENIDMSEYFKNNPNFSGETTEEGFQRITLGRFRDYWEADKFKKVLRKMGVKEAWIVPYKEGTRVPLKEVLENLPAKPQSAGK
ncbi:Ezrin/radixin/moesin family protein [Marivirga sp. S37H4]|uniref:Ezrin/radixin/moesin family protein n=1 Tax=Marivirga aurantiaca TaxID=2802615 RepID=A0A934X015_9BACT|nr:Ezrin/radixin/moesin family protein [Marivirga aurantiaca]MBK6265895.1 Ezrin/radixin/moesin family protein [Marivirga aurantiaca]